MKWFRNWVKSMDIYEKLGFLIGGILSLIAGIALFIYIDTTPATPADYEYMRNQILAIQENHDLLLKKDCQITVQNEVITVVFENEECKLIARFNQDFELLSTSMQDNYMFWLYALLICILIAVWIFGIAPLFIAILLLLLNWLIEKFKLPKRKRKNS